ncbi:hypothetical protein [Desulfovibrio sp. 86]|uniref:hypothetical protein n=1 Tax=Desulfovibrio sp. 86 TaxID=2666132 RepID=UPI0015D174EC|nr:hypothetical protein [Desulfovibrio sp. 86]
MLLISFVAIIAPKKSFQPPFILRASSVVSNSFFISTGAFPADACCVQIVFSPRCVAAAATRLRPGVARALGEKNLQQEVSNFNQILKYMAN